MEPELTQFEKEYRNALPAFLRPPAYVAPIESKVVERWIEDCIEQEGEGSLPSKDYIRSFQAWSGTDCTVRELNKILRRLGYHVNKVVRIEHRTHRCWVNVRLKEKRNV